MPFPMRAEAAKTTAERVQVALRLVLRYSWQQQTSEGRVAIVSGKRLKRVGGHLSQTDRTIPTLPVPTWPRVGEALIPYILCPERGESPEDERSARSVSSPDA